MSQQLDLEAYSSSDPTIAKKPFVMTRKFIETSEANKITVTNNEEGYKKYFSLGGTVAKMDMTTTKNYMRFKKRNNDEPSRHRR